MLTLSELNSIDEATFSAVLGEEDSSQRDETFKMPDYVISDLALQKQDRPSAFEGWLSDSALTERANGLVRVGGSLKTLFAPLAEDMALALYLDLDIM